MATDLPEDTTECLRKHVGVTRLLAFREDDRNNRRLLFDSDGVDQQSSHGEPDPKLLAEMIFGSTPTVCSGESIKLHQFRNPARLMFTKIFPAHQFASGAPPLNELRRRSSVDPDALARKQNINTSGSMPSLPKFSHDGELMVQRFGDGSRRSSESSEDCEILPALSRLRRQRIGIAVLFTFGEESQTENDPFIRRRIGFLCSQSSTVFTAIKAELQDVVLTAYCARLSIVDTMRRAWERYLLCMKAMIESTCRAHHLLRYFKLMWTPTSNPEQPAIKDFINGLVGFATKYDTKQTNFILSTMITAVLGLERSNGDPSKAVTELRIRSNDVRILIQMVEIIGYFLKYVVSDFDCLSVKPAPISLTRSLSSRSATRTTGTLASLWNLVRRGNVRERTIIENVADHQGSPSEQMLSSASSRSSPAPSLTLPLILVKENGLNEDFESVGDKHSELDQRQTDVISTSISSSVKSFASTPNAPGSIGASAEEDELFASMFDTVEEKSLPVLPPSLDELRRRTSAEALSPLCGDLDSNHKFDSDELTRNRHVDVIISFCESSCDTDTGKEALIIDATTWKVYQACTDELLSPSLSSNWSLHFPSALITETLENVRTFHEQGFDAAFCLMYLEDELNGLFSKARALIGLIHDGSDKIELRSEFCSKILRCGITDLSFLIK